jgi:hypothetical protein
MNGRKEPVIERLNASFERMDRILERRHRRVAGGDGNSLRISVSSNFKRWLFFE